MIIKKFLDLIKTKFKKETLNEYETLFLKFITNKNFENATIMMENGFQTSPLLSKELNKQLLIKLYHNPTFLSINTNFIKKEYKETENESENQNSVNMLLNFLITHDLLSLDFLFDTQETSLIITNKSDIHKKLLVEANNNFNDRFNNRKPVTLEKLFLSKNYFSIIKKNTASLKKELKEKNQFFHAFKLRDNNFFLFENSNIFMSSLSFQEHLDINLIHKTSNCDFLKISNFRNSLSLKDICKLTELEKKDVNFLTNKFPHLTNKNIQCLIQILNSQYLTNILLISQLSRHIIQKSIDNKESSSEVLINKLNSSKEYKKTPLRDLIYTIGFLDPQCLKNLDKKLSIEILDKIKESLHHSFSYYKYRKELPFNIPYYFISPSEKSLQNNIFLDIYNDIKNSFDPVVLNKDEETLNKFLKESKSIQLSDDYLKLAKNMKLNEEIISYLENTQKISKTLLLSLQTTNSSKSLEFQEYIKNINTKILNIIYDYQQLNDVVELDNNKTEIEESSSIFLKDTILQIQKDLEDIMNYIHQENLNSLITNQKFVKNVIK